MPSFSMSLKVLGEFSFLCHPCGGKERICPSKVFLWFRLAEALRVSPVGTFEWHVELTTQTVRANCQLQETKGCP